MRLVCTIIKQLSQLVILTAVLMACKPETTASRTAAGEDVNRTAPTRRNVTPEVGVKSYPNLIFGSPAEELAGIYTGINEDEKFHEFVLFEKSLFDGRCVTPTLDNINDSEKGLRLVFLSIPDSAVKSRFTSPVEAQTQKIKITFASEARNSENDSKVMGADRGAIDFKNSDPYELQLDIEASQGDQSRIEGQISPLNCSPNRVSFLFPGQPRVANTFKRYIEVVLTAVKKPNNVAQPKIVIHLDAMEKPSVVSIAPGDYDVAAQLITERKEGLQVLRSTKIRSAFSFKPGLATNVELALTDPGR